MLNGLKDEKINNVINECIRTGTIIKFLQRDELDAMAQTKAHQGIIAEVEDFKYVAVDDIINYAKSKNEEPLILNHQI